MLKTNPAIKLLKDAPQKIETVSPSAMGSYLDCGLKYRLSSIEKIKRKVPKSHFVFGDAFHRGAQPIWLGGKDKFGKVWQEFKSKQVDYREKESWDSLFISGKQMTDAMINTVAKKFIPILPKNKADCIEVSEEEDLKFVVLRRRIDLILEAKKLPVLINDEMVDFTGSIRLDLKTSGRQYNKDAVKRSFQLKSYAVGSADLLSAYLVVTKSVRPVVQLIGRRFSKEEIKYHVYRIKQITDEMRRGVFIKVEGDHCAYCDYRELCYEEKGWEKIYVVSGH